MRLVNERKATAFILKLILFLGCATAMMAQTYHITFIADPIYDVRGLSFTGTIVWNVTNQKFDLFTFKDIYGTADLTSQANNAGLLESTDFGCGTGAKAILQLFVTNCAQQLGDANHRASFLWKDDNQGALLHAGNFENVRWFFPNASYTDFLLIGDITCPPVKAGSNPCPLMFSRYFIGGAWVVTSVSVPVGIEIKPGSYPPKINAHSQGTIPVAILGSATFDPGTVNQNSLTFGRTGNEQSLASCDPFLRDVNGDGFRDLLCHFNTAQTGFQTGDTVGVLNGEAVVAGTTIIGTEPVRLVPQDEDGN
jgi:hypothetical protein